MTDFASILRRRRFTVERWLESEQITSQASLESWMQNNSEYAFSSDFIKEAKTLITQPVKNALVIIDEPVNVIIEEADDEPLYVNIPAEISSEGTRRVKQKYPPKSVQTPKEEE